jgi:hypothetical protein
VSEDVRPCHLAENEEHQDVEKPQEVDVDRANAVVFVGTLKDCDETEGHGNLLFCLHPAFSLSSIEKLQ